MNNFIHSAKNASLDNIQNGDEFYCMKGQEDFLDSNNNPRCNSENSDNVLAKKIVRDGGAVKYTIKLDNNGKIFNPMSIYGETKISSFLDRVCRSQNKYKEVNLKAFNMYLSFLKTKNIAWLNNAEREM
jgi:hypothetical protein